MTGWLKRATPMAVLVAQVKESEHTLAALRDEHRRLETSWTQLRSKLIAIADGTATSLDTAATAEFASDYRQHVERENEVLVPAFLRAFDQAELKLIGQAMAEWRGVNWEELRAQK